MCAKRLGRQTLLLDNAPGVSASSSVAGGKEGEGPLKRSFDFISDDARFGERSWERSESALLKKCLALACGKAGLAPEALIVYEHDHGQDFSAPPLSGVLDELQLSVESTKVYGGTVVEIMRRAAEPTAQRESAAAEEV